MANFVLMLYIWTLIRSSANTILRDLYDKDDNLRNTSTTAKDQKEIDRQLNSNLTRDFLSSFNTSFERQMLYKQLQYCPYTSLCEYGLQNISLLGRNNQEIWCCYGCSCEFPNCLKESTCCLDILLRNSAASEGMPYYWRSLETCVSVSVFGDSLYGYKMKVPRCPWNADEELKRNCTDTYVISIENFREINEFVPVFDNSTSNVYKNKYCAYCNGIFDSTIEKAEINFRCPDSYQPPSWEELVSAFVDKKTCVMRYNFPQFGPETDLFCLRTISKCNQTGHWIDYDPDIERACRTYTTGIIFDNLLFKNIFCALCNGMETENHLYCREDTIYGRDFSFSGLLTLENLLDDKRTSDDKCPIDQMYDNMYDICRDLFCPSHKRLQDGACLPLYNVLVYIRYFFNGIITPLESTTVKQANAIGEGLEHYLEDLFDFNCFVCVVKLISKVETDFETLNAEEIVDKPIEYFIMKIEIAFSDYHHPDEFVKKVLRYHDLDINVIYNNNKTFKGHLQLTDWPLELFEQMENISHLSVWPSVMGRQRKNKFSLEDFIEKFATAGELSGVLIPHICPRSYYKTCLTERFPNIVLFGMKPCPVVKLQKPDTEWLRVEDGIEIVRGGFILKHSEFYMDDNETAVVCADTYKMYTNSRFAFPFRGATYSEKLVSFICTSLSIFSLAVTFMAFSMFPELRALLPGKNNMILVLILLGAQSMYLVTGLGTFDGGSLVCRIFGIVLHILWLLSMFWMNVCTYHLFLVFTAVTRSSSQSQSSRILFYLSYAVIMSAIPVCLNISISLSTSNSLGYGDSVCYISSQKMATYTFGIPTAGVVATNVCLFLCVMIKIKRGSMVKDAVNQDRNTLSIFAKLSTITGITWVFGYFYTWTGIVVFSYLFILFNASQGIFLIVAFIFNSRVRNMIMSELSSKWKALSTSASSERPFVGSKGDGHM